jgi:hypothetical protein
MAGVHFAECSSAESLCLLRRCESALTGRVRAEYSCDPFATGIRPYHEADCPFCRFMSRKQRGVSLVESLTHNPQRAFNLEEARTAVIADLQVLLNQSSFGIRREIQGVAFE